MMGEKKALLMKSEDWRAVEVLMTGKKDSAVDEEEAVDLTVAG